MSCYMWIQPELCIAEKFVMLMLSRLPLRWLWWGSSSRGWRATPPKQNAKMHSKLPPCSSVHSPTRAENAEFQKFGKSAKILWSVFSGLSVEIPARAYILFGAFHIVSPLERQFPRSSGPRDFRFYKFASCSKSRITSPDLLLGF